MHLQWLDAGALGTNAIVGGGVPLAAGNAWAQRHDAEVAPEAAESGMGVTVTYFGDGASNIGSTLETMNLAAAWRLPLCFYIENNLYAVSTHVADVTGEPRLAARGPGFGIKSWRVDGMDPLAVYLAQQAAVEYMRAGKGATLIEAETYRYFHQNGPFPGSAFGYRSKEEEKQWRDRDPLAKVAGEMIRRGLLTETQQADLIAQITELVAGSVAEITEKDPESTKGARRIRPALWPDPGAVDSGIRSDQPLTGRILGDVSDGGTVERRFVDAIADVLDRRMAEDPGVLVLGEDIHRLKGGTNGATRG